MYLITIQYSPEEPGKGKQKPKEKFCEFKRIIILTNVESSH